MDNERVQESSLENESVDTLTPLTVDGTASSATDDTTDSTTDSTTGSTTGGGGVIFSMGGNYG